MIDITYQYLLLHKKPFPNEVFKKYLCCLTCCCYGKVIFLSQHGVQTDAQRCFSILIFAQKTDGIVG